MPWIARCLLFVATLLVGGFVATRWNAPYLVAEALTVLVLVMSLVAALVFWIDKRRAPRGVRRIPESTLWLSVWAGGALGAWAAMRRLRHKTRKPSFRRGIPIVASLQVAGLAACWLT